MAFWRKLLGAGKGFDVDELARRLELPPGPLAEFVPEYSAFTIHKRGGGERHILAPSPELKALQRRILRRVLSRLRVHPCAVGFERGHSIVSAAAHHCGKAVVIRMDIKDFFSSTSGSQVRKYFRKVGWNRDAAELLTKLCTHEGSLPQGAPTSPRLSNLVNYRLDARLAGLAARHGAAYSRYADDLTFSFGTPGSPETELVHSRELIHHVKTILRAERYTPHTRKKLHIRRRHQQQSVCGLVVNTQVSLPRSTRRWLRAVEHRMRTTGSASLSPDQLAGWRSLQSMIERQRAALD